VTLLPDDLRNTITCSDALAFLKTLPDESVNTIVTSPAYFGLRSYMDGEDREIGKEKTLPEYIQNLVLVFREVRRILREDGVAWVNLGDSYASAWAVSRRNVVGNGSLINGTRPFRPNRLTDGFKEKDLMMVPARVAIALQDDGWYLRQDCIWSKVNPMPGSQRDRPTTSHEHVFMLSKRPHYWYDEYAVREPAQNWGSRDRSHFRNDTTDPLLKHHGLTKGDFAEEGRTLRSVFTIPTEPSRAKHYAAFPTKLVEICLKASCPSLVCAVCGKPYVRVTRRTPMKIRRTEWGDHAGNRTASSGTMLEPNHVEDLGLTPACACDNGTKRGIVLDPFMGSGRTAITALRLNRDYIGVDLNPEYVAMARDAVRIPHAERETPAEPLDLSNMPLFADGVEND